MSRLWTSYKLKKSIEFSVLPTRLLILSTAQHTLKRHILILTRSPVNKARSLTTQSRKLPSSLQRVSDLHTIFSRLHKDLLPPAAPDLELYQTKANTKAGLFLSVYRELLQQLIPVLQGRKTLLSGCR